MRTRVVGKKDFDLVSRSDSPLFFGFIKLGRERERERNGISITQHLGT